MDGGMRVMDMGRSDGGEEGTNLRGVCRGSDQNNHLRYLL